MVGWSRGVSAALAIAALMPAVAIAQDEGVEEEAAAERPPELTIEESGWSGGAFSRPDDPTLIGYCGISRDYDNGLTLVFSTNLDNQTRITLINPEWALTPDSQEEIQLGIDGRGGEGPAIAASDTVLVIPLGELPQMIEALRQGNVMTITTSEGEFAFPLTGTFAALPKLGECVAAARELMAEVELPQDPAEEAPPEEASPTDAPADGMPLEALVDILTAAGLEDLSFVPPEQVPETEMDLRYIWQVGDINGALHQRPRPSEAIEIDGFSEEYLALLEGRCPGEFIVELADSEVFQERYALRIGRAECLTDESASVLEMAFALDQFFYSVFYHEATMEDAEQAAAETAKIANLIRELAGGEN